MKKIMVIKRHAGSVKLWVIVGGAVLALIFLLIAIPSYLPIRQKGPETRTKENLHYACRYANEIFKTETDRETVSLEDLKKAGFFFASNIELAILDDKRESLKMRARHKNSNKTFVADSDCNITEQANP